MQKGRDHAGAAAQSARTANTPVSTARLGQPVDKLLAIYAIVGGIALFFPHRTSVWPVLAVLHVGAVLMGFGANPLAAWWERLATRWPAVLTTISVIYPLVLVPFLYAELPALNLAVWDGFYFDDLIIRWEGALFGGQPSRELAIALPILPLSEVLHASYLSYYFIIFVPPLVIWARRGREAVRNAVFALILTFLLHYLFFIYFPVQGPRYLFPAPGGVIANGWFYKLAHAVLEAGSSQGAAFPSSHVGVGVAQTLITWKYVPRLAPLIGLLAIGLAVGAVYGGFHYATDAVAGAILGIVAVAVAPKLSAMLALPQARETTGTATNVDVR